MLSRLTTLPARLRRSLHAGLYRRAVAGILGSAPLAAGTLPCTLLSMVQRRDVLSYLVALKSFHARVPARRIVVVCDPSITPDDRRLLLSQVPGLQLHAAAEFADPRLPRGGTWERLQALTAYAAKGPVVQLDADTLTLAALPEVLECVATGRGFVLGEEASQTVEPFATSSARARPWTLPDPALAHVQAIVEADLPDAGLPAPGRYVRGCSGFTGLPQDAGLCDRMLAFSQRMAARHGKRWTEWGTEQICSNYLVANTRDPLVLPFPRYGTPDVAGADAAFLHFIGYLRFVDRRYERMSRQAIRDLADAAATERRRL